MKRDDVNAAVLGSLDARVVARAANEAVADELATLARRVGEASRMLTRVRSICRAIASVEQQHQAAYLQIDSIDGIDAMRVVLNTRAHTLQRRLAPKAIECIEIESSDDELPMRDRPAATSLVHSTMARRPTITRRWATATFTAPMGDHIRVGGISTESNETIPTAEVDTTSVRRPTIVRRPTQRVSENGQTTVRPPCPAFAGRGPHPWIDDAAEEDDEVPEEILVPSSRSVTPNQSNKPKPTLPKALPSVQAEKTTERLSPRAVLSLHNCGNRVEPEENGQRQTSFQRRSPCPNRGSPTASPSRMPQKAHCTESSGTKASSLSNRPSGEHEPEDSTQTPRRSSRTRSAKIDAMSIRADAESISQLVKAMKGGPVVQLSTLESLAEQVGHLVEASGSLTVQPDADEAQLMDDAVADAASRLAAVLYDFKPISRNLIRAIGLMLEPIRRSTRPTFSSLLSSCFLKLTQVKPLLHALLPDDFTATELKNGKVYRIVYLAVIFLMSGTPSPSVISEWVETLKEMLSMDYVNAEVNGDRTLRDPIPLPAQLLVIAMIARRTIYFPCSEGTVAFREALRDVATTFKGGAKYLNLIANRLRPRTTENIENPIFQFCSEIMKIRRSIPWYYEARLERKQARVKRSIANSEDVVAKRTRK